MRSRALLFTLVLIFAIIAFAFYLIRLPGNDKIRQKNELIYRKLKEKGYQGGYFIISEKRHCWYNKLLPNSIAMSSHLKGLAMDYWLTDLNDDRRWNRKDIDLMVTVIHELEKEHPELAGRTVTYLNKGALTSRMVHTDVNMIKSIIQ
jgi:hypothetical protein